MATATMTDPFAPTVPTPGQATELIAGGDYVGALVKLIDLGTHDNDYKGETKEQRLIYLVYELDEEKSDGTNHLVGVQYNNSYNDKAGLRLMIEKCLRTKLEPGQKSPLMSMMGQSFNISIENTKSGDRTYHKVAKDGVGPLHKRDSPIPPGQQRPHFTYAVTQGRPNPADFADVPYLYGRPVYEVINECKELFGSDAPAAAEPAARSSVERDTIIGQVEGLLKKANMTGEKEGGPLYEKANALMRHHIIGDTELSKEAQDILACPF